MPMQMVVQAFVLFACLLIPAIFLLRIIIRRLKQRESWQFSLKSLMIFVTLFAVWISQFAILHNNFSKGYTWNDFIVVVVDWSVLAVYYLYRKTRLPLIAHCLAIGFFLIVACFTLLTGIAIELTILFNLLLLGFFIGSLASFPIWVLVVSEIMDRPKKKLSTDISKNEV
jgi:hypothetical protein